ncbi:MAG: histidine phosphatase family protein [bacterium]
MVRLPQRPDGTRCDRSSPSSRSPPRRAAAHPRSPRRSASCATPKPSRTSTLPRPASTRLASTHSPRAAKSRRWRCATRSAREPSACRAAPAGRARQTAALIAGGADTVEIVAALRPLDGDIEWSERSQAWRAGDDLRPAGGESLADGRARVAALLDALRAKLGPGERGVWVTHGDIASLVLGELRGTPLLERPTRDTLDTGGHACLPLGATR